MHVELKELYVAMLKYKYYVRKIEHYDDDGSMLIYVNGPRINPMSQYLEARCFELLPVNYYDQ